MSIIILGGIGMDVKDREIDVLTVEEVAKLLKLSKITIYRFIKTGEIPAYKIGASWRINRKDLENYIESKKAVSSKRHHE